MLSLVVSRVILFALPFVGWWLWGRWSLRTGRPMGSTPWGWLVGAAALLVALSLAATVVFHEDTRGQVYVPAEATPDGRIVKGHWQERERARRE